MNNGENMIEKSFLSNWSFGVVKSTPSIIHISTVDKPGDKFKCDDLERSVDLKWLHRPVWIKISQYTYAHAHVSVFVVNALKHTHIRWWTDNYLTIYSYVINNPFHFKSQAAKLKILYIKNELKN